jgi:hypothetical protein
MCGGPEPGPADLAGDPDLAPQQRRGFPAVPGAGRTGPTITARHSSGSSRPTSSAVGSLQSDGMLLPRPQTLTRTDRRSRSVSGVTGQGTSTDSIESTRPVVNVASESASVTSIS